MDKLRVTLAAEVRAGLEQLVSVGKGAARRLTHARVLLLADTATGHEFPDEEIVVALGIGLRTVERVRKRLVTEGLAAALDHKSQPLRPDKIKIKGDIERKLVELACSDPPEGRCHWTLQLLADRLVVLGLLDSVSIETVRQARRSATGAAGATGQPGPGGLRVRTQRSVAPVADVRAVAGLAARACDRASDPQGLCEMRA